MDRNTENCNVFILGCSQENVMEKFDKNLTRICFESILDPFCLFRANINFLIYLLTFFLDFFCWVKFQKKTNEEIPRKTGNVSTYVHVAGQAGRLTDRIAWIHRASCVGNSKMDLTRQDVFNCIKMNHLFDTIEHIFWSKMNFSI